MLRINLRSTAQCVSDFFTNDPNLLGFVSLYRWPYEVLIALPDDLLSHRRPEEFDAARMIQGNDACVSKPNAALAERLQY